MQDLADKISNRNKNITIKLKELWDCSSESVIYAARCKKYDSIYVGHTGVALRSCFDWHRYDIKNRPGNSELAEHFHGKNHRKSDKEVSILQTGDRCICRLQTRKDPNTDINQYVKDIYGFYSKIVVSYTLKTPSLRDFDVNSAHSAYIYILFSLILFYFTNTRQ